jgi:hypothetical protein
MKKIWIRLILGCLGAFLAIISLLAYLAFVGIETRLIEAESADQQVTVQIDRRYYFSPMYGWNHYSVSTDTKQEIRCISLKGKGWRGTPQDILQYKQKHKFAIYNDFDQSERFPTGIEWISQNEFEIVGGEGDGSVFEIK